MTDEMRSSEILLLVIVLQPIVQNEISYPKSDIVANNVVGRLFFYHREKNAILY